MKDKEYTLLQYHLSQHLPELIKFIGERNFPWKEIDDAIEKNLNKRVEKAKGGTLLFEINLYDNIILAKENDIIATGFLEFVNTIFKELLLNLSPAEKELIILKTKDVLKQLDNSFLNFVGELAVLNNLIKSKAYTLKGTEYKLSNNKSIDYLIRKTDSKNLMLVEILNIHINNEKVLSDKEEIRKFFTDRLSQKIEDKTKSLVNEIDFILITVLWGKPKAMKVYKDFFSTETLLVKNVLEPCCLLMFIDENNKYTHRFGTLSTAFVD